MNNQIQQTPHTVERFVVLPCGRHEDAYEEFVSTLADCIINRYERILLSKLIGNAAEGVHPYRVREMLLALPELSGDQDFGDRKRQDAVKRDLNLYFSDHDSANIEGLVMFRLKNYQAILAQTAECLIDRNFIKREHEEFISLLRYFVSVQNDRPKLAHLVVHQNCRYTLHNEDHEDITALCLSDFIASGESVVSHNADDLLISILITLAPERLVIHGKNFIWNHELFETVERVFEKTEYCEACTLCDIRKENKK